jgi:Uma2 family endonuclease
LTLDAETASFGGIATMTVASKFMTLDAYLNYDDETEASYELVNGELVEMPPESELNRRIAMFLVAYFLQNGIPSQRLTLKTEIVVSGARATARFPDVMMLSEELEALLVGARRSTVMLDMPPPLLVIEIVSPKQETRDYRYKRSEYAARGIKEYWIVDPMLQRLTVLEWVYEGDNVVTSPLFGVLELKVSQILQG